MKHLRSRVMQPKPKPDPDLEAPDPLPPGQWVEGCHCMRCASHWANLNAAQKGMRGWSMNGPGFRDGCAVCLNRNCPHHTDHRLDCTGSNELGQPGSVYK
jgi:hypothetical protein